MLNYWYEIENYDGALMAKYSGLLFVLFAFTDFKNGLLGE